LKKYLADNKTVDTSKYVIHIPKEELKLKKESIFERRLVFQCEGLNKILTVICVRVYRVM